MLCLKLKKKEVICSTSIFLASLASTYSMDDKIDEISKETSCNKVTKTRTDASYNYQDDINSSCTAEAGKNLNIFSGDDIFLEGRKIQAEGNLNIYTSHGIHERTIIKTRTETSHSNQDNVKSSSLSTIKDNLILLDESILDHHQVVDEDLK